MAKQRRLEDLYVTGKVAEFDDGLGDVVVDDGAGGTKTVAENVGPGEVDGTFVPYGPVRVWVQPLNVPEHEKAARKAAAARATVLMWRHDETCEGYLEVRNQVETLDDDYIVEYLTTDELYERAQAITAEMAAEEEWAKEDYLTGLTDAWDPPGATEVGLKEAYTLGPSHERYEEAAKVFAEMKRFQAQVDERLDPLFEMTRMSLRELGQAELRRRYTALEIKETADKAWGEEYRRCELWLGTREPCATCLLSPEKAAKARHGDHSRRYFPSREVIDVLPDSIFLQLRVAFASLSVDVVTGKGSPATPSSSPSSEPSAAGEPEGSSGLVAASA